jgi:prophage tail gpP-like protein
MLLKLLSTEQSLTTANTVADARVVRIYNNTAGTALITRIDEANNAVGTCTLQANTVDFFEKYPSESFSSNVAVLATSIAFTTT